ncbi:hypothetical protein HYALB_00007263 [Hymenoscyphus albidus]|uniref:Uncharacterized protein n=1 Tax=Hymenoscyphus albidus TaxID=595503 RepID=A0A9N9PYP9_9HELO|nr:hypothetical protein HYALB_00007263 [Hymenoscyphus albidus]
MANNANLALVLFNPANAAPAVGGGMPLLQCSGQELANFCVNNTQLNALALPGQNVYYLLGLSLAGNRTSTR